MFAFTQTADTGADAGTICIHASSTLNKMADKLFTIQFYSSTVRLFSNYNFTRTKSMNDSGSLP
jgi:hypothetical protein